MPAELTNIQIVKRPLITEKSTWEATGELGGGTEAGKPRNRYSFVVDLRATKDQIKKAVAELYNVRVERVSTQIRKGKHFRTKFGESNTGDWKKATVQVHRDDKIELF